MFSRFLLTFILSLALASPTWAAGSTSPSTPTRSVSTFGIAEKAVKVGNYARAIQLLQKEVAKDPNNADAWNYLGFSHRKLGQMDAALSEYKKALTIDPDHRGANEYLGELYIKTGRMDLAKERLAKLDKICLFGCKEYDDLKATIKANGG